MMALLRIWPTEPLRFLTDKGLFFYKYDALRKACTQLYYRTMTVYQEYQDRKDISGDFEVEGKIFLGYEYPAHHPIQTETENRCGLLSHVEVSIHSMMRVAHGRSDSVESGLLSKVSMRNWRIGWGWKLRTTIGMRDWIENGRKICILYSPFIIYTIIATSHYTTSYMSVSSTWKYMWIDKSKRILASEILLLYFYAGKS